MRTILMFAALSAATVTALWVAGEKLGWWEIPFDERLGEFREKLESRLPG